MLRIHPTISIAALLALSLPLRAQQSVNLERTIRVPSMTGGFDHITYDPASGRLFVAAEDQGRVYVFAYKSGAKLATIQGFAKPHSVLALPGSSSVLVIDSEKSKSALLGSASLQRSANVPLLLGANCLLYDPSMGWALITAGGDRVGMKTSQLAAVDPATGRIVKSTEVAALHLQPLSLDTAGKRLFVSIADHKSIGIFDEQNLHLLTEWKLGSEKHNHQPLAFDAERHKLYVAIDHPGELVVIDTQTGKPVSSLKIPDDADSLDFDPVNHRLFIPCGDGFLMVLDVSDPLHVKVSQSIPTGKDAATGVWLAKERRYLVGVPQSGAMSSPEIRVFSVR